MFFKVGGSYSKINFQEILFIQAEKRYVTIVTACKCYFSQISIGEIEKHLPPDIFRRVHRSYIISLRHTDAFDNELVYIGKKKIPIAEQYKNVFKNSIIVIHGNSSPFSLGDGAVDKLLNDLKP